MVEFEIATDLGPAFPEAGVTRRLPVVDKVPLERFRVTMDAANGVRLQTIYRQIPDSAIHKTSLKGATHLECELGPIKARKRFESGRRRA